MLTGSGQNRNISLADRLESVEMPMMPHPPASQRPRTAHVTAALPKGPRRPASHRPSSLAYQVAPNPSALSSVVSFRFRLFDGSSIENFQGARKMSRPSTGRKDYNGVAFETENTHIDTLRQKVSSEG